jgi:uncharacterized membrane protein
MKLALALSFLVSSLSFGFTVQNRCQHPIFVAMTEGAGVDWNEQPTIAWGWREIAPFSSSSDFPSQYAGQAYRGRSVLVQYKGQTLTTGQGGACIDRTNGFRIVSATARPCRSGEYTTGFVGAGSYEGTYEFTQCKNTDAKLRVCNNSDKESVVFSIVRHESGSWTSHGWYRIDANPSSSNHCHEFNFGNQAAGSQVLYYAEWNGGQSHWPAQGDGVFCVDKTRAFELRNADAPGTCSDTANYKRVSGGKIILREGTYTKVLQ